LISHLPELLVKGRSGSNSGDNYGEQLLPICSSSAKSEGTIVFVSSRASSWCVRFVDRTSNLCQSTNSSSAPARVSFPGEYSPLLSMRVLHFLPPWGFPRLVASLMPLAPRRGALSQPYVRAAPARRPASHPCARGPSPSAVAMLPPWRFLRERRRCGGRKKMAILQKCLSPKLKLCAGI
jgi:hypothetical protein